MEVTFNRDWVLEDDIIQVYHPLVEAVTLGPQATIFRGSYKGTNILDDKLPRFYGSLQYAIIYASSLEFSDSTRYIYGYLQRYYASPQYPNGLRLLVLNAQKALAMIDEWIEKRLYSTAAYMIIAYGYFRFPQIEKLIQTLYEKEVKNPGHAQLIEQLIAVYDSHVLKLKLQGRVPDNVSPQYNGRTSFTGDISVREYDHDVAIEIRRYCKSHYRDYYQGYLAWMLPDLQPKWTAEWPDPLMKRHITPGFFNHDVVIFNPRTALCTNGYELFHDCDNLAANYIVPAADDSVVRAKIKASISNKRQRDFAQEARLDLIQWPLAEAALHTWLATFTQQYCPLGPKRDCYKELHPSQYSGKRARNSAYLSGAPTLYKNRSNKGSNKSGSRSPPRASSRSSPSSSPRKTTTNQGKARYIPPHQRPGPSKWNKK